MENPTERIDVFQYQDFRSFLKDYYNTRRQKDRKFSIRFFARRAGLRSQNYLKVVMDGRRSLTSRNVPKFVKGLGLEPSEAEYFETLVNYNQARDLIERREYFNKLGFLHKKRRVPKILSGKQMAIFNHWRHLVIYEMACQENFNPDPKVISKKLGGRFSVEQIQESLDIILGSGILTENEHGKLVPVAPQLASPDQLTNEQLRSIHKSFVSLGIEALESKNQESKEMRTLTIGLTKEQVGIVREKISEFMRELNSVFTTNQGQDIYQINLQFFRLTKSESES